MKSGPTLNAWTRRPRPRSASSRPSVMDVLPTPVDTPATTRMRIIAALLTAPPSELAVSAGAGREALRAGDALPGIERRGADQVLAAEGGGEAGAQRLVGRAAVAADAERREGRDRGGERFGFVTRLAARHDAVRQTDGPGLAPVHRSAGPDPIERAPEPDQRGQAHRAAVDQRDTPAPVEHAHHGVGLDDAEVAPERQLEASGDGVTRDRRQPGLRREHACGTHRPVAVRDPALPRPGCHRLQIGARAE